MELLLIFEPALSAWTNSSDTYEAAGSKSREVVFAWQKLHPGYHSTGGLSQTWNLPIVFTKQNLNPLNCVIIEWLPHKFLW